MWRSLVEPSAKWEGATKRKLIEVGERVKTGDWEGHKQMTEREEGTGFGGQCHWRGREKRKLREKVEITRLWKGERESCLFLSTVFLPKVSPPFVFIPLLLPLFYAPQLHFQNHTFILKSHSYSLSDKWHSFLQEPGSGNLEKHWSTLQCPNWLPKPSRSPSLEDNI